LASQWFYHVTVDNVRPISSVDFLLRGTQSVLASPEPVFCEAGNWYNCNEVGVIPMPQNKRKQFVLCIKNDDAEDLELRERTREKRRAGASP
jgi:hypothetical protein